MKTIKRIFHLKCFYLINLIIAILSLSYVFNNKLKSKTIMMFSTNMMTATGTSTSTETSSTTATSTKNQSTLKANFMYKSGSLNKINTSKTSNTNKIKEIENKDLSWTGWIKYFKLLNNEKPSGFKVNISFEKQAKDYPDINLNEVQNGEFVYIHDVNTFYGILYTNHFNILKNKNDFDPIDSFKIKNIIPLVDDKNIYGGLKNFGKFPEGYCFQVITTDIPLTRAVEPSDSILKYIICTSEQSHMLNLLKKIKNLKIEDQRFKGIILKPKQEKSKLSNQEIKDSNHLGNLLLNEDEIDNHPEDRWIILKNWSQCSLLCGGGKSTLQRKCTLPQGKNCKGSEILTKTCNTEPCPSYIKKIEKIKKLQSDPIVINRRISNVPERYEKCITKQKDVLLSMVDKKNGYKYRLPVRLIMNTETISFYSNAEDIKTAKLTYLTKHTELLSDRENYSCFIIKDASNKSEVCPLNLTTQDIPEEEQSTLDLNSIPEHYLHFINEWSYDYNLFKFQCSRVNRQKELQVKLSDDLNKKKNEIKEEIDEERKVLMNRELQKKEKLETINKLQNTEDLTLEAIKQEAKIENLITEEQKQKEELKIELLKKEVDELQNKQKQCRLRIKEKQRESQLNLQTHIDKIRLQEAQEEAKRAIFKQRENLKEKISMIKKKSLVKEVELKKEIINLRNKINTEIKQSFKKGDENKCKISIENEQNKKMYCDANFGTVYIKHKICMSDEFCNICCENEFGSVYIADKEICIENNCLQNSNSEAKQLENSKTGKWVFLKKTDQ